MNMRVVALPVLALTLALAGCAGASSSDASSEPTSAVKPKTSVGGVVLVPADAAASAAAGACVPTADFVEVTDGAAVTVATEAGDTLGEATLSSFGQQGDNCALSFFISDVARDKGTYTVTVNGETAETFSEDDLFAGGERRIELGK